MSPVLCWGERERCTFLVFSSVKSVQASEENRNAEKVCSSCFPTPTPPFLVTLCSNDSSNIRYWANTSSSSKVKMKFTGHLLRVRYDLSAPFEIYNLFLTIREALLLSYFTEGETEA